MLYINLENNLHNNRAQITEWSNLIKLSDYKCVGIITFPLVFADAGISNYIAQTEKFGTGVSDGPIYSTIDPTSDDMRTFNGVYSQHTTPYATTPVVPYGGQNLHSPESEDNAWNVQAGTSGILYAQPERNKAENGN